MSDLKETIESMISNANLLMHQVEYIKSELEKDKTEEDEENEKLEKLKQIYQTYADVLTLDNRDKILPVLNALDELSTNLGKVKFFDEAFKPNIFCGFIWNSTPQGREFWKKLDDGTKGLI